MVCYFISLFCLSFIHSHGYTDVCVTSTEKVQDSDEEDRRTQEGNSSSTVDGM